MKQGYNFNKNPKMPSDKDINKHQNFEQLMGQFEVSPHGAESSGGIIKALYYLAGAAAAALIGFVAYNSFSPSDIDHYQTEARAHFAALPYVNAPIQQSMEQFEDSFEKGKIQAETGGVFTHSSGTKLYIPSNAFVHADGGLVTGEVEIQYREFHDVADIFLSGIPMEYDSLGLKRNLESAGMMEVYAEQNGERLDLADGKIVDVEMTSHIKYPKSDGQAPSYNVYRLDEEDRNWVFEGIDDMELVGDPFQDLATDDEQAINLELEQRLANIEKEEKSSIETIEKQNPLPKTPKKPIVANNDRYSFDLDVSDADFPELKVFKKIMWQSVNPNDFTEATANETWTDLKLNKQGESQYLLTLFKDDSQKEILVQPVLTGKDAKEAMANYEQHFEDYARIRAKVEERRTAQKAALAAEFAARKEAYTKDSNERLESYKKSGASALVAQEVIRQNVVNKFSITNMGIWNCDRPLPPFVHLVNVNFTDEDGLPFQYTTVFQADKSLNTIYRYLATNKTQMRYNTQSENTIWLITAEGKIAKAAPDAFAKVKKDGSVHTFVLETIDRKIEDAADVRAVLGISSI